MYDELLKKIKLYVKNDSIAKNYSDVLSCAKPELREAVSKWVYGDDTDFSYSGIDIKFIMSKEHCNVVNAFVRMKILMDSPQKIEAYKNWTPIIMDGDAI